METYYIYEIPGVKIGCTTNFERRQKGQSNKGKMILLETHTDIDKADERERELQAEKGYKVEDKGFKYMRNWIFNRSKESLKEAGLRKKGIEPPQFKNGPLLRVKIKAFTIERKGSPKKGYTYSNKRFYKNYNSVTEAANELNLLQGNLSNVLNGRIKSSKGYTFEYA